MKQRGLEVGGYQFSDVSLDVVFGFLVRCVLEVLLAGCSGLLHGVIDGSEDIAKTNADIHFWISPCCANDSVLKGFSLIVSHLTLEIIDGHPTSKADVRTSIPAVRVPAIDVVWRRRYVEDVLTLDDKDPERFVK